MKHRFRDMDMKKGNLLTNMISMHNVMSQYCVRMDFGMLLAI
jgi:hypothetical protein